jgi:hypothetical protein
VCLQGIHLRRRQLPGPSGDGPIPVSYYNKGPFVKALRTVDDESYQRLLFLFRSENAPSVCKTQICGASSNPSRIQGRREHLWTAPLLLSSRGHQHFNSTLEKERK